ncbi:MAG: class I SAM-dependent methyltransferase [Candidatus Omnitrophica bacterium]|nr:class I SAM-dependent methyltransferase [Candidatus Omnitrophota bacterium]
MEDKIDSELILGELLKEESVRLRYWIHGGSIGQYTKSYERWKRTRNIVRYFLEESNRVKGRLHIIDIGCGNGLYTWLFKDILGSRDSEIFGIDISEARIHLARRMQSRFGVRNVSFLVGDAAAGIELPAGWADIVFCGEVIEHIAEPMKCLREVYRVLKPDGTVIITTPNKNNPVLRMSRLCGAFYKQPRERVSDLEEKDPAVFDRHVSVKGLKEWTGVFNQSGFKVGSVRRGSLFCGGSRYDRFPLFFGFILILEAILDRTPFAAAITENLTFKLHKIQT